jgi:hypothetical protein
VDEHALNAVITMKKRPRTDKPVFRGLDHERRSCTAKKRFSNPGAARAHAAYLRSAYPDTPPMTEYSCEFCGGWHLAKSH